MVAGVRKCVPSDDLKCRGKGDVCLTLVLMKGECPLILVAVDASLSFSPCLSGLALESFGSVELGICFADNPIAGSHCYRS